MATTSKRGRRSQPAREERDRAPRNEPTDAEAGSAPTAAAAQPGSPPAAARQGPLPPFAIAGIGASAGGLQALFAVVDSLPDEVNVAIAICQHQDPSRESTLSLLLDAKTKFPVVPAADGTVVAPNHIYVIPSNAQASIADGKLHLSPRPSSRGQLMPIDSFLRSLAMYAQSRAVGVILSGTGSDGAMGISDIKSAGGITIVQQPETAKHAAMPRAAIATRMIDLILPPHEIATALTHIGRHPERLQGPPLATEVSPINGEHLQRIFELLRAASGVDFKQYKLPTIERRLHRRMVLNKLGRIEDYLRYLEDNPDETKNLYRDILISVTRFFREPESFQALAEHALPAIVDSRRGDNPIRIWVSGCATGEEAYSVAIALLEFLGDRASSTPVQIFATDLSDTGIDHARAGIYPDSISADVSPDRLRRFFTKVESGYRINNMVRDLCIFAHQDLTRDPPFSKLDLILCRNVLIYMSAELQRRLITLFHYALKSHGCLILGPAETIGPHSDLFTVKDKKHRIYAKKLMDYSPSLSFQLEHPIVPSYGKRTAVQGREGTRSIQNEASQIILDRFAPPGVIVDSELQIVQFRGQTGMFLQPPSGEPSHNLLKMARDGLLYGLRTALHAARKSGARVRKDRLRVRNNGGWQEVCLEVIPLSAASRGHFLILFEAQEQEPHDQPAEPAGTKKRRRRTSADAAPARDQHEDSRIARLHKELAASREYLQSIIQELEAANEELQSANEEILSSNEELQSTNEELDTAKEELQSTNEELSTVNEELHGRNDELSSLNSDLVNLLASVQIAIVIVASDLRIRRFTPMAEKVLNLIPSDIGRPISHIKPNIDCPDLERMISEAVDTVSAQEREVQDRQGNWFSLRIRPYKNVENRIDGAVLTLFDIDAVKRYQNQIRELSDVAQAVVEAAREPLLMLDAAFEIKAVNTAFCNLLSLSAAEVQNRTIYEILRDAQTIVLLRTLLENVLPSAQYVADYELPCKLPRVGRRRLLLNARRAELDTHRASLILLAIEDATPPDGAES